MKKLRNILCCRIAILEILNILERWYIWVEPIYYLLLYRMKMGATALAGNALASTHACPGTQTHKDLRQFQQWHWKLRKRWWKYKKISLACVVHFRHALRLQNSLSSRCRQIQSSCRAGIFDFNAYMHHLKHIKYQ